MNKEERIEKKKKEILNLLTKDFKTTNEITAKGKSQGLYNNWVSYEKYLSLLLKANKVEQMRTSVGILWRKK